MIQTNKKRTAQIHFVTIGLRRFCFLRKF